MDRKASVPKVERGKQRGDVAYPGLTILPDGQFKFGNWGIEFNHPFGFVVRNAHQAEEYHFKSDSNGWITGVSKVGKKKTAPGMIAFNSMGQCVGTPVPIDKEATKKYARVMELQMLAKSRKLNAKELQELATLTGLLPTA